MEIIIGNSYNNWTVIAESTQHKEKHYECVCICGTKRDVKKGNLGVVKGCGCQRKAYVKSNKPRKQQAIRAYTPAREVVKKKVLIKEKVRADSSPYIPSTRLEVETLLEQKRIEREYEL